MPEAETGVRFDDPQLAINWPLPPLGLSEREVGLGHVDALERARQWRSHFAQRTFPHLQADRGR